MLRRSLQEASVYSFLSHNPLVSIFQSAFGFQAATAILGLTGLGVFLLLVAIMRPRKRLVIWSLCAVISMFWGYRKHYDLPLMVFPLIALFSDALDRRDGVRWCVYTVFALTLWFPLRDSQWHLPVVQWIDLIVWCAAIGLILFDSRDRQMEDTPEGSLSTMGDAPPFRQYGNCS